jgi:hypothetical protein
VYKDYVQARTQTYWSGKMGIHKLLLAGLFSFLLVVPGPYVLAYLGFLGPLADKAWLILFVTMVGLLLKSLAGDIVSGEFFFHKFGYDNCVMTFAAVLTACGLQLASTVDLFPGLSSFTPLAILPTISQDQITNRLIQLFVFLLVALVFTLITAAISGAINKEHAKGTKLRAEWFLAFLNSAVGLTLLAGYVVILVTKG